MGSISLGAVSLPLQDDLYRFIDQAKNLPRQDLRSIIESNGIETDDRVNERTEFWMAMCIVRMAWYREFPTNPGTQKMLEDFYNRQVTAYLNEIRIARSSLRFIPLRLPLKDRHYQLGSGAQEPQKATRYTRAVLDTLTEDGPRLTFEQVCSGARSRTEFAARDGGRKRIASELTYLAKLGLVDVVPAQARLE